MAITDQTVWLATIDSVPTKAGNWSDGVPAPGDALIFNEQAIAGIDGNDWSWTGAAETNLTAIVEPGYGYHLGSSAAPLVTNQWEAIIFKGSSAEGAWFESGNAVGGTDTGITTCVVDSSSPREYALNLGGKLDDISIINGKVALASNVVLTLTAGGRVDMLGGKLSVPATAVMTSTLITMSGGEIVYADTSGSVSVYVNGGTLVLSSAAALALLVQTGGTIWYDSTGTITEARIHGGKFGTRLNRDGQIITNIYMSGNGQVDLAKGGLNPGLLPNGIRIQGQNMPILPSDCTITVAVAT